MARGVPVCSVLDFRVQQPLLRENGPKVLGDRPYCYCFPFCLVVLLPRHNSSKKSKFIHQIKSQIPNLQTRPNEDSSAIYLPSAWFGLITLPARARRADHKLPSEPLPNTCHRPAAMHPAPNGVLLCTTACNIMCSKCRQHTQHAHTKCKG